MNHEPIKVPEETWKTSISEWADNHWNVTVDLWTVESGQSAMVLGVRVFEAGAGFRIVVDLVSPDAVRVPQSG